MNMRAIRHIDFRADRTGFTLVEVGVSIAILGTVLAALLVARGRSVRAYRVAAETMTAARLCASQAAALRAGVIGEGAGEFARPAGYTWRIARSELPEDAPEGLKAFTIRVMPGGADDESSVVVTLWLRPVEARGVKKR